MQLMPDDVEIGDWENDYRKMASMFYSDIPSFSTLLSTLQEIETQLKAY